MNNIKIVGIYLICVIFLSLSCIVSGCTNIKANLNPKYNAYGGLNKGYRGP